MLAIVDGGLESLVASMLVDPPKRAIAWFAGGPPDQIELRRSAAASQADLIGLESAVDSICDSVLWSALPGGFGEATLLLAALAQAAKLDRSRVLWPRHVAGDLNDMLDAADRALLVHRIGLIELENTESPNIRIDTPLIDLTDRQLVELAVDLDAPVWSCWFEQPQAVDIPAAQREKARWEDLLKETGGQRLLSRDLNADAP